MFAVVAVVAVVAAVAVVAVAVAIIAVVAAVAVDVAIVFLFVFDKVMGPCPHTTHPTGACKAN